jgi:hypothetical protein
VSILVQFDGAHLIDSSTHVIASRPPQIGADSREQKTMPVSQIMDAVHPTLQIRYTLLLGIETAERNYRHQQNMPKRGISPQHVPILGTAIHNDQQERCRICDGEYFAHSGRYSDLIARAMQMLLKVSGNSSVG